MVNQPRYIVVYNEKWNEITNESVHVSRPIAVEEAFGWEADYAYTVVVAGDSETAEIEHWDVDGTFDECRREAAEWGDHIREVSSPYLSGRV